MINVAHFIFLGDRKLPSLYRDCLNSFTRLHPSYKINIWNFRDVEKILKEHALYPTFIRQKTFINRYNLCKYTILHVHGGWFIDLDIKWKRTLDDLITDKFKVSKKLPQLYIPVRSFPREKKIDYKRNDDMLLYSEPGLFLDLINFAYYRRDIDYSKKYEPFGPVSLSKWLSKVEYTREYLYEWEIQKDGTYCSHLGGEGWKFL